MEKRNLLLKIISTLLITSLYFSCIKRDEDVIIEGEFPRIDNATVSLSEYDDVNKKLKTENIINGKYSFNFKRLKTGLYFISINWPNPKPDTVIAPSGKKMISGPNSVARPIYINSKESTLYKINLIIEGGEDTLKYITPGDIFQKISIRVVSSSANSTLHDFLNRLSTTYQIRNKTMSDSLLQLRDKAFERKEMKNYTKLNNRLVDLWRVELLPEMLSKYRKIFRKNRNLEIVPYYISNAPDLQQHYGEYNEILTNLIGEAASSNYSKYAFERLKALKSIGMSQVLPNPVGFEPNGEKYDFNPGNNKATLIDFWASWCAPCRSSNPMLIKIYENYKNEGFEILGVSMDIDKNNWKNAIIEDRLPWKNISDLKPMSSSANAGRFNLVEIPQNYLIDHEGRIIGINLYDEALERSLKSILKIKTK